MWEAYDWKEEDLLWTGIPFMGGISGFQQAPCGAVTSSAICLGLRHRAPLSDRQKAKEGRNRARYFSSQLVKEFNRRFGDITCIGLLGIDFDKPGAYKEFRDSGVWRDKCEKYIEFLLEKLYAFEGDQAARAGGS